MQLAVVQPRFIKVMRPCQGVPGPLQDKISLTPVSEKDISSTILLLFLTKEGYLVRDVSNGLPTPSNLPFIIFIFYLSI